MLIGSKPNCGSTLRIAATMLLAIVLALSRAVNGMATSPVIPPPLSNSNTTGPKPISMEN
jgi:hypothetical protein